ncbi:MAG: NADH-quinone oxidoreductase subunit H [Desulfomicrobium escambiense]|nr:NADH-quinone oxidoreductase subunit H [Desulfomicrobium escambiense]
MIGLVGVLVVVVVNALVLTWAERKVSGHMQRQDGPKEVGPFGLLQPIADTLKLIAKELLTPQNVEKPLYFLAPVIVFIPVMVSFVVIPFDACLQVKDINVGILVILAFSSLSVLSILLAGWGSNNKYSLIGAVRSVAQNIAYEIPLLLALLSVVLMANSLSLKDIVEAQKGVWYVFLQPIAFLVFFHCRRGRDEQNSFDLAGGRKRTRCRVPHRIFGYAFCPLLPGRIHKHVYRMRHYDHLLSWRISGTHPAGLCLVSREDLFLLFLSIIWFRWTFPRVTV